MKVQIIGAGMAGLLAGNMLRSIKPEIFERSSALPNNHKALLRFRTLAVAHAIGVPFKKVNVIKDVHMANQYSNLAAALAYGVKVGSHNKLRSITSAIGSVIEERHIAPDDLISKMVDGLSSPVNFDVEFNPRATDGGPVISTMPMPTLAKLLGYEFKSEFKSSSGYVGTALLPEDFDLYATMYFPHPDQNFYRASITGRKLIVESLLPLDLDDIGLASFYMGIGLYVRGLGERKLSKQAYAKIHPIDEEERKKFIMWATTKHNIYSLGRFATWRPGLLLDDVVHDVRVIQRMINGNAEPSYDMRKS